MTNIRWAHRGQCHNRYTTFPLQLAHMPDKSERAPQHSTPRSRWCGSSRAVLRKMASRYARCVGSCCCGHRCLGGIPHLLGMSATWGGYVNVHVEWRSSERAVFIDDSVAISALLLFLYVSVLASSWPSLVCVAFPSIGVGGCRRVE